MFRDGSSPSQVAGALALLVAAAVAGCHRPEAPLRVVPVHRFVDAPLRLQAESNVASPGVVAGDGVHTAAYPAISLQDEVRYALGMGIRAPLFFWPTRHIGAEPRLPVSIPVPAGFQVGDRVAVEAKLSLNSAPAHLPPFLARVELVLDSPALQFDLSLPDEYANRTVGVHVQGTVVPKETALYHRTAAVSVPGQAYLDFAMGIEKPAWGQGPVEFQVRACIDAQCEPLFREVLDPAVPDERSWQARRVDLGRFAEREVSFSFESRLLTDKTDAFSLPVWANATVYAPAARQDVRPNIILISIDTLSAEHLPTYGYRFPTTPFIDGVLAREGTVFDRAVAAATTTPQSHMSMFTSVQPCQHGVTTGMELVRDEFVTIAEVLRAGGYETGAVTEDGWLGFQHGFGHGFNFYAENKSANVMIPEGQIGLTMAKARSWIVRNDDKPFFLFLHTFQVHDPYRPPDEYKHLFRERDGHEVDDSSPRQVRDLVAYDQEIRYTDDQLRELFDFLGERGLLDDTVIVFTADHGEEFLQHGEWGHGRNLFDPVTHVPLMFWGPGRIPQGQRRAETAGHIDLMPTILTLAGVSAPPQATGRDILAAAPPGDSSSSHPRFCESRTAVMIDRNFEPVEVFPPSFMVQQGTRKMARYREAQGFRYESYDLASDPEERNNRVEADAAAFEPMKRMLDEYESSCADRLRTPSSVEAPRTLEMDPEREQKLRALGYLQ